MKTGEKTMQRRGFLKRSVLGLGLSSLTYTSGRKLLASVPSLPDATTPRLPREVWIACMSSVDMLAEDVNDKIGKMLLRMKEAVPYKPDIVCLPEFFLTAEIEKKPASVEEIADPPGGPITKRFAEFAKKHSTYVICPMSVARQGRYYNAAVIIDRQGVVIGEYRKAHLTDGEMEYGLTPGTLDTPVFDLDFGRIGVQICFDLEYLDGWQTLNQKDAEIVFWPSAFAGGQKLNMLAKLFHYVVASSTRKTRVKICDIDGSEVAKTGIWQPTWCCGSVNLEKAFLHTWPFYKRFDEIKATYGRKIKITTFHEEEWSIIESRSADVKVADVLKEFEIKTYKEVMGESKILQDKNRP